MIGDLAKVVDWKLKAGLFSSVAMVLGLLKLLPDLMLCREFVSDGERGLRGFAE